MQIKFNINKFLNVFYKKIISCILLGSVSVSLFACNNVDQKVQTTANTKTQEKLDGNFDTRDNSPDSDESDIDNNSYASSSDELDSSERDTRNDWNIEIDDKTLFEKSIFITKEGSCHVNVDHVSSYLPPKILCFFKRSDAQSCLNYLLKDKYLKYQEISAESLHFDVSEGIAVPPCDVLKTDLGEICQVYLSNINYVPEKSKLIYPDSPTAWLIVTWKEKSNNKYQVALVDVYAAKS